MGKPTGFLDYSRQTNPARAPEARIRDFDEFHPPLALSERQCQGARCMNCGVPFCQSGMTLAGMVSGCPLHNLIPEWNDEIYRGNWGHALDRLTKTSSFPEFTGRVCPALCEAACTCGLNGAPVTVRENELAIIEHGFAEGLVRPRPPRVRTGKRIAVIGSGPAGLAAADRLNRRGHSVTVFERDERPGGLLQYGIPNMKLDKAVVARRVELMRAEGVTFACGKNVGADTDAAAILTEYDAVILACGAKNPRDLRVPGREGEGVYFAVDFLASTTRALTEAGLADGTYLSAKGKNVVIVGGGDTGNDCVGTCIRHGCASVTQLEMMPKSPDARTPENPWPQWPRVCKTDYGQEEAIAVFGHDPRVYQTTVKEILRGGDGKLSGVRTVKLAPKRDAASGRTVMEEIPDTEEILPCELLLIAAGFLGCEPYVAETFGAALTPRTNIDAAYGEFHTNVPKVFAAGDARRGQSLVVWAIAEGRAAARAVDLFLMGYTNMI